MISKISERSVHNQLVKYLEENKILSSRQFGYRRGHSIELATLLLTDEIGRKIDDGQMVGSVFIDLSKAFDTLSHSVLILKMKAYGIRGMTMKWFTNYLFNRSPIYEVEGQRSEPQPLACGVPQGSILGPLMFFTYFNDFESCLKHSKVVKFADDTVIYLLRKSHMEIKKYLNEDLKNVADISIKMNLLNLKSGKTESIIFGTGK